MSENQKDWTDRDSYNALTVKGTIAEDPHYVVRFKGQCWGFEGGGLQRVLDGIAWQMDVTISERREWEKENAREMIEVYDRQTGCMAVERRLGYLLPTMDPMSIEEAFEYARQRAEVMDSFDRIGTIVGVDGRSGDGEAIFIVDYEDDGMERMSYMDLTLLDS